MFFRNMLLRFNNFRSLNKWTTGVGALFIFLLVCTFFFVTLPAWKTSGPSQFVTEFIFFFGINFFVWTLESASHYDPDTTEFKVRRILSFLVGLAFFGWIIFLGYQTQSVMFNY